MWTKVSVSPSVGHSGYVFNTGVVFYPKPAFCVNPTGLSCLKSRTQIAYSGSAWGGWIFPILPRTTSDLVR
jgi:hypothetical protein